jgi:hypothetical protein
MKKYLPLLFPLTIFLIPFYIEWMTKWWDKFPNHPATQMAIGMIAILIASVWLAGAILIPAIWCDYYKPFQKP